MCKERCCEEQIRGFVVHDSHAEVLARRGLINVLWEEIIYHLKNNNNSSDTCYGGKVQKKGLLKIIPNHNDTKCNTEEVKKKSSSDSDHLCFELKGNIQLHLYISDSPCGDASIYNISSKYASNMNNESENGLTFTGAKILVPVVDGADDDNFFQCCSSESKKPEGVMDPKALSTMSIAREKVQIMSALRLKSGRSNIPDHLRSSSMSCSDKICKWIITGIQGCGALARFLPNCIRLSSLVVSRDPRVKNGELASGSDSQLVALKRALTTRAEHSISALVSSPMMDYKETIVDVTLPDISISDHLFPAGKAVMEKRKIDNLEISLNENAITVGTQTCGEDEVETTDGQAPKKRKAQGISCHGERKSKRQKGQKFSSCGISLNWQHRLFLQTERDRGNEIEQTVGAKGILQRKKPKCSNDVIKCSSRLSRHSISNKMFEALTLSKLVTPSEYSPGHDIISYQQTKDMYAPPRMRKLMHGLLHETKNPLQGWVKNSPESDFHPHLN